MEIILSLSIASFKSGWLMLIGWFITSSIDDVSSRSSCWGQIHLVLNHYLDHIFLEDFRIYSGPFGNLLKNSLSPNYYMPNLLVGLPWLHLGYFPSLDFIGPIFFWKMIIGLILSPRNIFLTFWFLRFCTLEEHHGLKSFPPWVKKRFSTPLPMSLTATVPPGSTCGLWGGFS
jgi:hypothetical protein